MNTVDDLVPGAKAVELSDEVLTAIQRRVASAYVELFSGNGSLDDASLVLVDLARFARYYDTTRLDMPADQVKALDQRRAVLQRILDAFAMSGRRLDDLHGAVLRTPDYDEIA